MKTRTWIVLADATSARLYAPGRPHRDWALVAELQHPEGRARDSDLVTDKPGRRRRQRGRRGT